MLSLVLTWQAFNMFTQITKAPELLFPFFFRDSVELYPQKK
jgi:hypothetical protein